MGLPAARWIAKGLTTGARLLVLADLLNALSAQAGSLAYRFEGLPPLHDILVSLLSGGNERENFELAGPDTTTHRLCVSRRPVSASASVKCLVSSGELQQGRS